MSGRIRSIKPELLDDAVTAGLSDMAFRIFVSAIVLADDYGRLRAEPGWLMGQIYWTRTLVVEEFTEALKALDPLVQFYQVNGQRYAVIRNWSKHQKVSHPGKPRVPPPEETLAKPSGGSPEALVPDLRSPISDPDPDPDQGSPTTHEQVVVDVLEPGKEPVGARYQAAYAEGVTRGKGAPWVWPGTKYAEWDLGKIIKGHAVDGSQKPYRGDQLLRCIEHTAAEFASSVIAAKKAQYYSAFEPRGCLKWLNEVDMAEEARRVG